MKPRHLSSPAGVNATPAEVVERMRRADPAVQPWIDAVSGAPIDPDVPEVVGPPARIREPRIRRRT
jgi:hypothetical protein